MTLTPIGLVRSPVADTRDDGWGSVVSELRVDAPYASGLAGLEQFSHLLVVFWMHQAGFDARRDLLRRPRGRADMPEVGIFAQRAKHRPNPIGVTAVRLIARRESVLIVQGLDAVDGSPLLDLKPYVPLFDRVEQPKTSEWLDRLMVGYF
jgi:tRNA (adenine37-N6)-methyltransferase